MFKEGDKVRVRRHRCGIDIIGPFVGTLNYIDDGVADVTGPDNLDYGIDLRFLELVTEDTPACEQS